MIESKKTENTKSGRDVEQPKHILLMGTLVGSILSKIVWQN